MKKLFLFLTLLIAGITTNAQYTPYNNLNYMKLLKVPPIGAVEDSVLVYSGSDSFVKMRPTSTLITKSGIVTALGYTPENEANKATDFTTVNNTLYPTVQAVVDGLATKVNSSSFTTTPTATAFSHYFGETASDGVIRPKTLANVRTEIVTTAAVDAAKPNILTGTGTTNTILKATGTNTYGNSNITDNGSQINSSIPVVASNSLETAYIGSFIGQGGNPSFVQKLERVGGSFAFTPLVGSAKNTTTNLTSKMYEVGAFGDLQSGVTAPELTYFYLSVANDTYNAPSLAIFPNRNIAIGKTTNNGNRLSVNGKVDVNELQLNTTPATASGTPPVLTWNSTTKNVESVPYSSFASTASPAFTGTPTAPTATAGTNTTQIATTAFVLANSSARPYKVYTALISQSGTSAPTATVLENTLGGTVVWTRTGSGSYVGTLAGVFTTNKTVIFVNNSDAAFGYGVALNTGDGTIHWENGADGRMNNTGTMIEIRVYP